MPRSRRSDSPSTDRRGFLGKMAASSAALVAGGSLVVPESLEAAPAADIEQWPMGLKGAYKQVFDAYKPDDGFGLAYAHTFLATQKNVNNAGAVLILRHFAMPIALTDATWARYKIGASLGITDPETKAPAVKNPWLNPKTGVLLADDMAINRLLERHVVVGACNVALKVLSGKLAGNAGVSAADAEKEWTAAIIPGITVLPSGVWGVNRAQVKGCTYCAAG